MSANPDYDKVAEAIRQVMLKRLSADIHGQTFAMVCLEALARDNKLANLFFVDQQ